METKEINENHEIDEFAGRIRKLRRHLHMSQKEFAESLGLSPSFISEVEAGKTKPGYEFFKNLHLLYAVNPDYLHKGEGDYFIEKEPEEEPGPNLDFGDSTELIEKMLWHFHRSETVRLSVLQFFKVFLFDRKAQIAEELKAYEEKEQAEKEVEPEVEEMENEPGL